MICYILFSFRFEDLQVRELSTLLDQEKAVLKGFWSHTDCCLLSGDEKTDYSSSTRRINQKSVCQ